MEPEIEQSERYIEHFKAMLQGYTPITEASWASMVSIIRFRALQKEEVLLAGGQTAKNMYFLCKGSLRAYYTDSNGAIYNKNIFLEGDLVASTVSLLLSKPSDFTLEALEPCVLIAMPYKQYRALIEQREDLKNFYIGYLEKKWIIEKEQREISLVMENATLRYEQLLKKHPNLDKRIPLHHIASHLGITPTQLSRIRKEQQYRHK